MDVNQLEQALDNILEDFKSEFKSEDVGNSSNATAADVFNVAYQTLCTLKNFKKEIINYLKQNE